MRLCIAMMALLLTAGAFAFEAETTLTLEPRPGFPRNSEGDFIELKSGRILFAYTRFTTGGSDFDQADVAMRHSDDGGATWSAEDEVLVPNEGGQNTMSVSFLRLADDRIALLYLRKNSRADCRPYLRTSSDEGETWSEPTLCIDRVGYYVVNNDRLVQLPSGRLVIPVAIHAQDGDEFVGLARAACRLSDDGGATWRWSKTTLDPPEGSRSGLQEPGVVRLPDERLLMFIRTDQGSQMFSYSSDDGETWTAPTTSSLISPVSPATIESLPSGDLVVIYNNHDAIDDARKGKRTPLTVAFSKNGEDWTGHTDIEANPLGWYCYIALHCTDTHMLLGYCAGDTTIGGLNRTKVVRIPLSDLTK